MTDHEQEPRMVEVEDHRMEILMTYTVFHIGLYMSLTAALIAADSTAWFDSSCIKLAIVFFLMAGLFGALIASNVAEYDVTKNSISDFFGDAYFLKLWFNDVLRFRYAALAEHLCFWIGIAVLMISFYTHSPGQNSKPHDDVRNAPAATCVNRANVELR